MNIEYRENLSDDMYELLGSEFERYAEKNGVKCDYREFNFIAADDGKTVGLITGHSYYDEVCIADLIVVEEYRGKNIGSRLIAAVEKYFEGKGFGNINLTTYGFQAADFYGKCGYELEYVRENKEEPKLSKYFFIKYIK